jgi:hypothetical protein
LNTIITIDECSKDDSTELSSNIVPTSPQVYCTYDPNNNETDQKTSYEGLGDFFLYNLMLLTIQPCSASTTTKVCITIGHIIPVQLGRVVAYRLSRLCELSSHPAVPLPVMMVSIYAVLLNSFICLDFGLK